MDFGVLWFFNNCLWCFTPQLFGKEKSPCFEDAQDGIYDNEDNEIDGINEVNEVILDSDNPI